MRRAMFSIALIGAAFLSGTFVNNRGFQYARSNILRVLGICNRGEITAVDLETNPNADTEATFAELLKPSVAALAGSMASRARPTALSGAVIKPFLDKPAGIDQKVITAVAKSPTRRVYKTSATKQSTPAAPICSEHRDFFKALSPSANSSTNSTLPPPLTLMKTGSKSAVIAADEWALVAGRMQSLGVTHFSADGRPGGPIIFVCLVTLAGDQLVTERFEAEADNVVQAAQSTMQRIILWRAAQCLHNKEASSVENRAH